MPEKRKTYPFRIHYKKNDGKIGLYYIRETNAICAITAFLSRTANERESVISVDAASGRDWKRVL